MIRIGSIVIRVDDLLGQYEFWSAALRYQAARPGPGDDFVVLRAADGAGPHISLDAAPSLRQLPPRVHLDLYADDQSADVERLVGLGAVRVEWDRRPADADYVILQDPEGNRFCVVDAGG